MIKTFTADLSNWGKPFPMGAIARSGSDEVFSEYCDTVEEFCEFFAAHTFNEDTELNIIIDAGETENCLPFIRDLKNGWATLKKEKK